MNINENPQSKDKSIVVEEHFVPNLGLDLESYIKIGDVCGVHHLIRYYWALKVISDFHSVRSILDIACGAGYGSYLIAKKFPHIHVIGCDYDCEAIRYAQQNYSLSNLEFKFGDGTRWEETIGKNRYDCIISFDTIEHITHREIMMQNLVEHLHNGGFLLLSTPLGGLINSNLHPAWEHHEIEFSAASLYDFLRRYFNIVLRPDNSSLPHLDVWGILNGTGIDYLLLMNPVLCKDPIAIESRLNTTLLLNDGNKQIVEFNRLIQEKYHHIRNLETTIAENNRKLNEIYSSTTWQILTKYQRLVDIIMPPATKRRCIYDLGIKSLRIIVNDGFDAFLYKLKERVRGSVLYASDIPIIEIKMVPPHVPMSLVKKLNCKFTFPSDKLNEIRILTATYIRRNSDLELHVISSDGKVIRKVRAKGNRIQDNGYTSFRFKPIKDSKGKIFFFKLMSRGEPSAAVWYNESNTLDELQLSYDDKPIKGLISFQAFADIGIKSRYDIWMLKNETTAAKLEQCKKEITSFEYQPKISIVTPVYNPDVAWIKAAIESVMNQVYENWELCIADASTKKDVKKCLEAYAKMDSRIKVKFLSENRGISGNSNEALALATGEYIGLLDHDDELSPDALYEAVKYLQNNRDADMIYSDEDKIDLKGNRTDPFFKPDWSPDKFLSHMYTCHFGVYRKNIIDEIGGFRKGYDGSQDYDLVLRFIEKTNSIHHIPKILYHWRIVPGSAAGSLDEKKYALSAAKRALHDYLVRNNIRGDVTDGLWRGSYHVKRELLKNPLISIIIPTKDNVKILKRCIDSILKNTSYPNYEIVIVNNNSIEEKTYDYFKELKRVARIKILEYKKDFNFSAINNFAVKSAAGEIILFLNNDTEVISEGWLSAMLEHVQRKEVGAVGCKLLYPDKTVQHAGVILGINYIGEHSPIAEHSPKYIPYTNNGYFGKVNIIHNVSAVTAACMMLRKDVFEEVGGFDDNLAVAYNDVDLCLKIRKKGYQIVYTPYAELYHYESQSRGYDDTAGKRERFLKEIKYIRKRWGQVIDKGDPYYNPNLTLDRLDFSIRI